MTCILVSSLYYVVFTTLLHVPVGSIFWWITYLFFQIFMLINAQKIWFANTAEERAEDVKHQHHGAHRGRSDGSATGTLYADPDPYGSASNWKVGSGSASVYRRIRIRIKVISWIRIWIYICRWQAKIYGIWAYLSIFSRFLAFIWKPSYGFGSASRWYGSATLHE